MHHTGQPVIQKPRSALSTLALGLCGIVITGIFTGATVALYGMHVVDRKADSLLQTALVAIEGAPEFVKSLPAPVSDLLNDRRAPEYADQLDVKIELAPASGRSDILKPVLRITNRGPDLVSLLALRVVVLDPKGRPLAERNEWAATPLNADDNWRGPILPGATRIFPAGRIFLRNAQAGSCTAVVEVTDVRVWQQPSRHAGTVSPPSATALGPAEKPASDEPKIVGVQSSRVRSDGSYP